MAGLACRSSHPTWASDLSSKSLLRVLRLSQVIHRQVKLTASSYIREISVIVYVQVVKTFAMPGHVKAGGSKEADPGLSFFMKLVAV